MPSITVEDYIRAAMVKAGVLAPDSDSRCRAGFHLLRHSDLATTLGLYAHANSGAKLAAQGAVLDVFFAGERAV